MIATRLYSLDFDALGHVRHSQEECHRLSSGLQTEMLLTHSLSLSLSARVVHIQTYVQASELLSGSPVSIPVEYSTLRLFLLQLVEIYDRTTVRCCVLMLGRGCLLTLWLQETIQQLRGIKNLPGGFRLSLQLAHETNAQALKASQLVVELWNSLLNSEFDQFWTREGFYREMTEAKAAAALLHQPDLSM